MHFYWIILQLHKQSLTNCQIMNLGGMCVFQQVPKRLKGPNPYPLEFFPMTSLQIPKPIQKVSSSKPFLYLWNVWLLLTKSNVLKLRWQVCRFLKTWIVAFSIIWQRIAGQNEVSEIHVAGSSSLISLNCCEYMNDSYTCVNLTWKTCCIAWIHNEMT